MAAEGISGALGPMGESISDPESPASPCRDRKPGEPCPNNKDSFILDLKNDYVIEYIMLFNRDDCCLERIIGASIELLSSSDDVLYTCGTIQDARTNYNISCHNELGSKVRVSHSINNPVQLGKVEVFGKPANGKKQILSRRKPTWQSSTLGKFNSWLAVDGKYEAVLNNRTFHRNCFHTMQEEKPFWFVDLQGVFRIDHVVLYNRMDCGSNLLIGAIVELLGHDGSVMHQCAQIKMSKAVYNISCENKSGRIVRIRGAEWKFLHICEVDVFGKEKLWSIPKIVSRGKPTSQSSVIQGLDSSLGVDGIYDNYLYLDLVQRNCFHTNLDKVPSWFVNLQRTSIIDHVIIYNRMDCCSEAAIGVVVELLSLNYELKHQCGKITESKRVYSISCGNMQAEIVRIRGPVGKALHLCEVDVIGESIENPVTIISKRKPTMHSSALFGLDSALAVNGYYNNFMTYPWKPYCFYSNNDTQPFWMVDLQGKFNIDHVTLYNRIDCCSHELVGAVIELVGGDGTLIHQCGKISEPRVFYDIPCGKRQAEKVRVRGAPHRFMHLCEVDVFGEKAVQ